MRLYNMCRLNKFKLQPYEILGYTWVLSAYLILKSLPVYYPILQILQQSTVYFGKYLLLATIVYGVVFIRKNHEKEKHHHLEISFWLEVIQISLILLLSMAFQFMLKSNIYLLNPRNFDSQLFQIDRALHFGIAPCFFFVTLFNSRIFYAFLDIFYSPFYYLINLAYVPALLVLASPAVRRTFATAYVMVCIVGLVVYVAVPSWGPVFNYPEEFQTALQKMPITVKVQTQLFKETSHLIKNPMGMRSIELGGIAAFPSLHVALLTLFALTSKAISKRWFHLNLIFVGFMMIGSVVTGYHYLIDGYAGLILGWGSYKLAGIWVGSGERANGQNVIPASAKPTEPSRIE